MNEEETSEALASIKMRVEALEHDLKGRQRTLEVRVGGLACLVAALTVGAFVLGVLLS
jgi:hypothetical protein